MRVSEFPNDNVQLAVPTDSLCPTPSTFKLGNTDGFLGLLVIIHPSTIRALELDLSERRSTLDSHALPYPLRIEASKFKTPTLDGDEGAELFIGFGGVWLRGAGRFKLGRALALAIAALPNEVGSAVFDMTDLVHLDAIKRYYLRMGFVATSALQPEPVVKVICGRNEICDVFEVSFDGEQKTLKRGVRGMRE